MVNLLCLMRLGPVPNRPEPPRKHRLRVTHPKVLEPKVLDPKVLVTKVLGSLNKGINWLYPVSDVKSLIGFHFFINDLFHQLPVPLCTRGRLSSDETLSMVTRHRRCWGLAASACASLGL